MTQAQEVQEQYESVQEYHQISSSGDQHVYAYEQTPGIITIANQPQTIQTASIQIKRDIIIDKDNIVNGNEPSISVVNAEPQAVYVELKQNENLDQPRYLTNVRYEGPERYHRYTYAHPLPPHLAHQREVAMKDAEAAQQHQQHQQQQQHQQEIHIYEAEQQQQQQQQNQHQQQQQQQSGEQQSEQQQPNESKTHYTNLEPVPSQNSYYITSENYQPTNGNFTYLQAPSTKEGYVYHHPGSPVMYKSNCFSYFTVSHSL